MCRITYILCCITYSAALRSGISRERSLDWFKEAAGCRPAYISAEVGRFVARCVGRRMHLRTFSTGVMNMITAYITFRLAAPLCAMAASARVAPIANPYLSAQAAISGLADQWEARPFQLIYLADSGVAVEGRTGGYQFGGGRFV